MSDVVGHTTAWRIPSELLMGKLGWDMSTYKVTGLPRIRAECYGYNKELRGYRFIRAKAFRVRHGLHASATRLPNVQFTRGAALR